MARRRHPCDVPGCDRERERWQRLCPRCFRALPAEIRTGVINAHKSGDRALRRQWRRMAGDHMAPQLAPAGAGAVDPGRAYALANRITGDRDDDDWLQAAE